MARLLKQGLDFYIDMCDTDFDTKLLIAEFGITACGVMTVLQRKIYGEKGYYLPWSAAVCMVLANEFNVDKDLMQNIVDRAVEQGIFDKGMYQEKNILTSLRIQEFYLHATQRRKSTEILPEYSLVENKCQHNADNNPQRRAEESIAEESIAEYSIAEESVVRYCPDGKEEKKAADCPAPSKTKRGKFNNVILSDEEYNEIKSIYSCCDDSIERLSEYMAATGKAYNSHYATLLRWARQDTERHSFKKQGKGTPPREDNQSFDIDEFWEAASKRPIEDIIKKTDISKPRSAVLSDNAIKAY